ncbi:MAG: hypothetical protein H0X40_02580 [Chthoniobacterales bacterium]|nr:hypothetical protein [Chthoniobacterales bacterium]
MSEPEIDPASIPLLFPDPVIEFYLAKIDRATIRERLKMSVDERLEALQKQGNADAAAQKALVREESPPWPPKKGTINMGVDPAWFAEARAVPLLVPDPVIEAYLEDVDRSLIRQALRLSVPERFERFNRLVRGAHALRRASKNDRR